jgi:TusA-related sulfurtransferase
MIIKTVYPVYISLSTIPSRFHRTFQFIQKLLSECLGFDKVFLNIPIKYKRFPNTNTKDLELFKGITDNRFVLNRCSEDYGPITKLIPTLEKIQGEDCILIILDDEDYILEYIKEIAEKQETNLNVSFSYYTYEFKQLVIGQGVDMISFWVPNLSGFLAYFYEYVSENKYCFYVDDLVISYFLDEKGVQLKTLPRKSKWVWNPVNDSESLFKLKGKYSRPQSMSGCYNFLKKKSQF